MKFGGTSVGSAESIRTVFDIVESQLDKDPIVVVSAVGGITDMIIHNANNANQSGISEIEKKHKDILKDLDLSKDLVDEELEGIKKALDMIAEKGFSKKLLDIITSFGEKMSSKIVAEYLTKKGISSRRLIAYDLGFVTDSNYTDAELDHCTYNNIACNSSIKEKGIVNVVTGFIAKDHKGNITTLGRGGSDFTATVIAAALNAEEVQIWTDADGVMSADPKIVKDAIPIPELSFSEAAELAYFGAKILHPKTILPAMEKDIPVRVLNTHNPGHAGTRIVRHSVGGNAIKAISSKKNIITIRVVSSRMLGAHGFLARLFELFAKHNIVVDLIATSEVSVSVTVNEDDNLNLLIEDLEKIGKVDVNKKRAIICVVGKKMKDLPGTAGDIFSVCGNERVNVEMISEGASQVNISFVVRNEDSDGLVKALHKDLIKSKTQ